ncbi:MAG TPA: protein kinase [Ktedonobacteraceae bacterium]|nr:protein kinase [Ktedonobacteraceae bacterium]
MLINSNELLGRTLGTCTLQRLLGRGGMGAVYLAQQSRPRRTVAVKVLLPGVLMEQRPRAEFLARFRREADAVAALDHVNIMPVYEYGEQEELAYLVMPYVTGGTLREVLEKRGILPLGEVVPIIEQAASALDSAHAQGIVHRDLKPANMLFHADGRILLADFGLAKVLRDVTEQKERESSGQSMLTSAGTIVGTPEYLSPEQGTGSRIDHRTDIYSLGIVLYQMLAGRIPFTGTSPVAVAIKHAMEEPPPLAQFNPTVSPTVEAVVMKAIAKDPDQRFARAGEFARALRHAAFGTQQEELGHEEGDASDRQGRPTPITFVDNDTQPEISPSDRHEALTEKEPRVAANEEQVASLPTVLMPTDTNKATEDIHEAPTEESPRVLEKVELEQVASLPTVVDDAPPDVQKVLPPRAKKQLQRDAAAPIPAKQPPTQDPAPSRRGPSSDPVSVKQSGSPYQPPRQQAGCQSVWMMLVGSLLTLLLVVGGFVVYLHYMPPVKPLANSRTPTAQTPQAKTKPTPIPSPSALPAAAIPAGSMLYGTALPGNSCDKHGAQWSNISNAKITCGSSDVQLAGGGSNSPAGTMLEKLPNGQMPNDYIIQVQASNSTGPFGVFFRAQPGSSKLSSYAFLIDPAANTWGAYTYGVGDSGVGILVVRPLVSKITGTTTIDVVVQGDTFSLYVNGFREGGAQDPNYTSGTIGLASAGANVSFKNLALYAAS